MSYQAFYLEEVLQKIQDLTGKNVNQSVLAEDLEVSRQYISSLKKDVLPFNVIKKIEDCYAINLLSNDSDLCVNLDYFSDVWASCGTGAVVFEEASEKLSVPTSLIQNYSKSNKYSVINARGDSMQPFLQDRDKLIVEHWNGGQIIDNCIYVFRYANELFVKRLVKNITQIVIKSDNPLYEPIKITDKDQDFEVIGQIVGLMRDLR